MNTKSKENLQNSLIFTEAFNKIEHNINNKIETNLSDYIEEADNKIDSIYVYNHLFNPTFSLKFLNKKKNEKKFGLSRINKNRIRKFNSYTSLNVFSDKGTKTTDNLKNIRFSKIKRNKKTFTTFNTDGYLKDNSKKIKFLFNTYNNINSKNNNKHLNNNKDCISVQINKDKNININSNKEEIKIIRALHKTKFNILKQNKKKFIKEMNKEKQLKEIDKDIENKTNTLFYHNEQNINNPNNNNNNNDSNNNSNEEYKEQNYKELSETIDKEQNIINLKTLNIKNINKCNSTDGLDKLSSINYKIYKSCIKNIKLNQKFSNIIKYVDKKRLTQYKLSNIQKNFESEGIILHKKLLKNQDKEVNFHKQELIKGEKNETLYNNFKKQIKERLLHKNLNIDSISKISNKLAFFGRKYFMQNYKFDYINDNDFLFKEELKSNTNKPKNNNTRLLKVKSSCKNVFSKMEKMAKHKNKIMKRIKDNEEKYKMNKNKKCISDDNDENDKMSIFNLSKYIFNLKDNHNYNKSIDNNNNLSKDVNNKIINELFLPQIQNLNNEKY